MSCGLGAVVLVFMLIKHNVVNTAPEGELLQTDIVRLEMEIQDLQQTLDELLDTSKSETDKIARLKAKIAILQKSLNRKELSIVEKHAQLAALKQEIKKKPIANQEDKIEDERAGEEDYLIGLKVEGERIAILVDSSASMTDEKLIDIIRRKNSSSERKKAGPKWQRTIRTMKWLLGRAPRSSQVAVLTYNDSVQKPGGAGYISAGNTTELNKLYNKLNSLVPQGATNLQKGLNEVKKINPTDIYLITDGLPTKGESRYTSLNPFAGCSSLLGRSKVISGECRVKLFRQTIKDTNLKGAKINVILLPIEGDPDAANEYWTWAAMSGGLLISPAVNWP